MIAAFDQKLAPLGLSAPIRFTLTITLVKLKVLSAIDGKRMQIQINVSDSFSPVKAADEERKIDVLPSDREPKAAR